MDHVDVVVRLVTCPSIGVAITCDQEQGRAGGDSSRKVGGSRARRSIPVVLDALPSIWT